LQYELSYPTVLAILNLAGVELLSADRTENSPIIAGGPGAYNPEPMSDFIDAFLSATERIRSANYPQNSGTQGKDRKFILKEISKITGVYVPALYENKNRDFTQPKAISEDVPYPVKKRINCSKKKNTRQISLCPIQQAFMTEPLSKSEEAVGECAVLSGMFHQFAVRERQPEEVVKLTDALLCNTGYEEYSLLSLSSNDYNNIEGLAGYLSKKHSPSGASLSLPSQGRILSA
jgi:hypothetical protein